LLRDTLVQILASIQGDCNFNIVSYKYNYNIINVLIVNLIDSSKITFGSAYSRLFVDSLPNTSENKQSALDFIVSRENLAPSIIPKKKKKADKRNTIYFDSCTYMGATEVWSALLSLSLLAKAKSVSFLVLF
jgi:hypothetical protein